MKDKNLLKKINQTGQGQIDKKIKEKEKVLTIDEEQEVPHKCHHNRMLQYTRHTSEQHTVEDFKPINGATYKR
jgi:hypothetical protein